MFDLALLGLAAGFPALTGLYWFCLALGGGLLLVSTVLGGHGHADVDADVSLDADFSVDTDVGADLGADVHADVGADVDADVGADVHAPGDVGGETHADFHDVASLASWFSVRFVVYFMATFGAVGVILTYMTDASNAMTAGCALLAGLIAGQAVHQLIRKLQRTSGNSTVRPGDYVNKLARVTIAIRPSRKGEVALVVRGGERFVPAVSKRQDSEFSVGDQVAVVGYTAGIAEVVSRKEYEFLADSD